MDLDTPTIREAQLGPIVLFYTKTKRVTASITRQADALVQTWSRPIIKRPADYRSKYVAHAHDERDNQAGGDDGDVDMDDDDETPRQRPRPSKPSSKPRRFDVRAALAENETRKGASLPKSNVSGGVLPPCAPLTITGHSIHDRARVARAAQCRGHEARLAYPARQPQVQPLCEPDEGTQVRRWGVVVGVQWF